MFHIFSVLSSSFIFERPIGGDLASVWGVREGWFCTPGFCWFLSLLRNLDMIYNMIFVMILFQMMVSHHVVFTLPSFPCSGTTFAFGRYLSICINFN